MAAHPTVDTTLGASQWDLPRGESGPLLGAALPDCEIAALSGETHIRARARDEAELYGLLERLRDFGVELVSISLDPDPRTLSPRWTCGRCVLSPPCDRRTRQRMPGMRS
jgi:hypothetical protein